MNKSPSLLCLVFIFVTMGACSAQPAPQTSGGTKLSATAICAEMKKDQSHEVTYITGSIEDPLINQKIVDILEGTRPAFDKRDAKYLS
ncbi:hypothetical protein FHW69_000814 [Luteibacter sp. Sphag1AF]|uniref:hypothetical protein n=1 Tax=Luteibacter sp. Sphag1AF TaxID=2587031 RepID=UPI0016166A47|nr:hypothetical protein [Luteibacter sp. Sphag1AF]MBB3226224.1 hypothetical protein [Luteibacter sp. Sphag1AF]